jgi:hypothetical protein
VQPDPKVTGKGAAKVDQPLMFIVGTSRNTWRGVVLASRVLLHGEQGTIMPWDSTSNNSSSHHPEACRLPGVAGIKYRIGIVDRLEREEDEFIDAHERFIPQFAR